MPDLRPEDLGIGLLFWRIPDAVVVADVERDEIVLWNPAAERIFGFTEEEVRGRSIELIVPHRLRGAHRAGLQRYRDVGHGSLIDAGVPIELPAMTRDGSERWVELSLGTTVDAGARGRYVVAVIRDVTERRRAYAEERRSAEERAARSSAEAARDRFGLIAEASALLASSLDYEATLVQVARLGVPGLADWCAVDLATSTGGFHPVAGTHADPALEPTLHRLQERYPAADDDRPVSRVVRSGRALLIPTLTNAELERTSLDPEHAELRRAVGFASLIVTPLLHRGSVLGALTFARGPNRAPFDDDALAVATELAGRAALAVEHARLFSETLSARQQAERAVGRAQRLQDLAAALESVLSEDEVARVVVDQCVEALAARAGSVVRLVEHGTTFEVLYQTGYRANGTEAEQVMRTWRRFPASIASPVADAVRTGQVVALPSAADRLNRYPHLASVQAATGIGGTVTAPLIAQVHAIGALHVTFAEERTLTEEERHLLIGLSRQGAVALERARLYEAERAARADAEAAGQRAAMLAAASAAFAAAGLDAGPAIDAIVHRVAEVIGDGCCLLLFEPEQNVLRLAAVHHPDPEALALARDVLAAPRPADDAVATRLLREGKPLLLGALTPEQAHALLRPGAPPEGNPPALHSLAAAPLRGSRSVLGTLVVWRDAAGREYGEEVVPLLQDLADRGALVIENARLYGSAQDAIRARDRFLSIAAHELRNPVAAVKSAAQLLHRANERGLLDAERLERSLLLLGRSADRLARLTEELLDVSRLQGGPLALTVAPVDLATLAGEVAASERDRVRGSHVIVVDAPPGDLAVAGDRLRLEQVLVNLVSNAVKYTPGGGTIRISLGDQGDAVALAVADEGIGLPAESLDLIFEPFGRAANATEQNVPGMGLGLYVSRTIVQRHGGRIWAESAGPGHGTTIHVLLPKSAPGESALF